MIKIYLGNVGSGKTACCVREMFLKRKYRTTYTNIRTSIRGMNLIDSSMIVKKEIINHVKRAGKLEPVYSMTLNTEFWKQQARQHENGINVIIDEAHTVLNARRSMTKGNTIMTDWLALIRRVLGSSTGTSGDLILISQLPNRIDLIARDMATEIRYHVCLYSVTCKKCGLAWHEHSELPEACDACPRCQSWRLRRHGHKIFVMHFSGMHDFMLFRDMQQKTFYKKYFVTDIEKYFKMYDTLQWDNLFSDL